MRRAYGLSVIEVLIAAGVLAILISVFSLAVRAVAGGAGHTVGVLNVERAVTWGTSLVLLAKTAAA